jgi:nucleotide-binding universal stress UspA family protein
MDESLLSRQILPQVIRLFEPARFELLLVRVAEPVAGLIGVPPRAFSAGWSGVMYEPQPDAEFAAHPIYENQVEASERDALEQRLRDEQRDLVRAGYRVAIEVRFGDPAQEIINCAAEHGVGLIAMATHGRTGWRRVVLGSVAEQVLRTATVPVLLLRPWMGDD